MAKKILGDKEPEPSAGERGLRLAKAAVGPAVAAGAAMLGGAAAPIAPWVAAAVSFITEDLWLPHLSMRKDKIVEEVAAKVHDVDPAILNSPAFIDAMSAGIQAAIKTSSETKREALRNAIVNSVSPTAPDLVKQQQFFALTDKFSELHLMLLDLFATGGPAASRWYRLEWANPASPLRQARNVANAAKMAEKVFHQHDLEFIRHVWGQLIADGLVRATLDNGAEGDITSLKRTTALGDEYLAFIRA